MPSHHYGTPLMVHPVERRCLYCRESLVDGRKVSGWTGKGADWMTEDGDRKSVV